MGTVVRKERGGSLVWEFLERQVRQGHQVCLAPALRAHQALQGLKGRREGAIPVTASTRLTPGGMDKILSLGLIYLFRQPCTPKL
ncbi:hypothetical protein MATL_G00188460 [Megalops atlanticus]|uniref:Uncharacterized protein n=1 Tax=Megalops atlanticus TaxID=7932 RepID=A0A9D3PN68_MEGAT|nr:hypothetical protein MATL_G00188460 [Megalops atlanticus]